MTEKERNFWKTVIQIAHDPDYQITKKHPVHGSDNVYHHSIEVTVCAWRIARFFHLNVDEKELAKGGMLHDFYGYNCHKGDITGLYHGFHHAQLALQNAQKHYHLTEKEKDIIYSHMWPMNLTHYPHHMESVLIGCADKYSAVKARTSHILNRLHRSSRRHK